jgi:protein SCO1/2
VRRPALALTALALLAPAAVVTAGCGGSSGSSTAKPAAAAQKYDAPALASPPKPAPDFTLKDSTGKQVSLSDYRGKSVLLLFIYSHCPDVCPLMVGNLHAALQQMPPAQAAKTQIIAVSVDPRGDTPAEVDKFLKAHDMTGRMEYLVGTKKQLTPVWKEYGIQVQADPETREQVGHSAFVYGITGAGQEVALYPSNFKPQWIVHDVPLLAAA